MQDIDVSVVDHGPTADVPEGLPVVLLHGAQGNWSHWRANVEALSVRHRVIVPDLPGFGLSGPPRSDLEGLATVIGGLLKALDSRAVALVGYSFGSLPAVQLAASRPAVVDRLLIINPPGWRERAPEIVVLQNRAAALIKQRGLREGVEFMLREIMLQNHDYLDEQCIDEAVFAADACRMRTKDISRSVDLFALLALVNEPQWHVLLGENDPYHRDRLDARRARLDATAEGRSHTTVIESARHWAQQDRPDTFNAFVSAFAQTGTVLTELPRAV